MKKRVNSKMINMIGGVGLVRAFSDALLTICLVELTWIISAYREARGGSEDAGHSNQRL